MAVRKETSSKYTSSTVPVSVQQLFQFLTPDQLDRAVDRAAKISSATAALFIASPTEPLTIPGNVHVELAIEFFVPPISVHELEAEVDRSLMKISADYAGAREAKLLDPASVNVVPPGTFHQWRHAWRMEEAIPPAMRWSLDRDAIDSLLRHVKLGWRELLSV
jgi:GH3 auxin-responsive promoter